MPRSLPPIVPPAQQPGALIIASPVAIALVEQQTPPDLVAEVHAFVAPENADTTTMTAYDFPVFLGHALEALTRDAKRTQQFTVAAMLDRGLRTLSVFPGLKACLDGRQELLNSSCDQNVHLWLEQLVAVDLPTAGLGHKRFPVRVAVAQHRHIGLIAGALGLPKGQCFTLALTAALLGSLHVAMDEANEAMHRTLVDLLDRCEARARDTETRLSEMRLRAELPGVTTVRRTIHDVLTRRR